MDFKVKDRRPARDAIVYEMDRTVEFTSSRDPWWLSLPVIEEITDEDYRRTQFVRRDRGNKSRRTNGRDA